MSPLTELRTLLGRIYPSGSSSSTCIPGEKGSDVTETQLDRYALSPWLYPLRRLPV